MASLGQVEGTYLTAGPFGPGFPRLTPDSFQVASIDSIDYNCIAWAVGETDRWWWPIPSSYYWPEVVPRQLTVQAFVQAFQTAGFEVCADRRVEPGLEKIAIYARLGQPTHAARQLPNGRWTSKLGRSVDIEHTDPDAVSGPQYGTPVVFMKRPIRP